MSEKHAGIGDKVKFFFDGERNIYGEILSTPDYPGDYWIIQTYFEGRKDLIAYIDKFQYMLKMTRP